VCRDFLRVRNVDQADFERRIWIVSSKAVGDHCSDIVSGDVNLLVPERLGQLVNILSHVLLVVAQPRFGRTSIPRRSTAITRWRFASSGMILWNSHQVWGQPGKQEHGRAFATLDIVDAGAVHFRIAVPEIAGK